MHWNEEIFPLRQTVKIFRAFFVKPTFSCDTFCSKATACTLSIAVLQAQPLGFTSGPILSDYDAVVCKRDHCALIRRSHVGHNSCRKDGFADHSRQARAERLVVQRRIQSFLEDFRPQSKLTDDMNDVDAAAPIE